VTERACLAASGGQATLPGGVEAGTLHEPGDQIWWLVLLATVAAVAVATVVVIQLLPNPGDGPPVVGATQVTLRGNRFHPPVIQITKGQTVTWSFNDGGATHNVKGTGWGSGDQASGTVQHTFTAPGSYCYSTR
jgi:plastocyanin